MNKNLLHFVLPICLGVLTNVLFAQNSSPPYPHEEINNRRKWGKDDEKEAGDYTTAVSISG